MIIFWDAFLDALKDTAWALPFLFAAYLLMEWLERRSEILAGRLFSKKKYFGPLIGSALGLVPQCGFSAAMSNLYCGGVIQVGTLVAVFLATSDEALILMIQGAVAGEVAVLPIIKLLITKFAAGIVFGYLLNFIFRKEDGKKAISDMCSDDNCGCEESEGIFRPAAIHTAKMIGWIFVICFALNILISLVGEETIARWIGGNFFFQPLLTALVGLIPNCAISVLFTRLYISGSLNFASTVAGLCTGAGLGLIVLFRMDKNKKECFKVLGLLYACGAITGLILNLF